ncbi:MAG: hypothetical protein HZA49_04235 [Planctomycetes bacterium]|nr:hypothetical protein [Planctomycetota bacterium]
MKECLRYNMNETEFRRVRSLARELMRAKGWDKAEREFAGFLLDNEEHHLPVLHIDDLSEIPHLDGIPGIEYYQQRARLRAGNGDLVALTHPMEESYEAYNQDYLGLGSPGVVTVDNYGYHPIFVTRNLTKDLSKLSQVAAMARAKGGIVIHPFMGSAGIWSLAKVLEQLKAGKVKVIAPLPYVTSYVNDKSEFAGLVESVLGSDNTMETRMAYNDEEVLLYLREMLNLYPTVAVKMRNYASAMGNLVFESSGLGQLSDEEFKRMVKGRLWTLNANGCYPVSIVRWYNDVISSPSSHLWMPPRGLGVPRLDGIFEQLLEDETKVFAGSRPAVFPERLKTELSVKTLMLGVFLQELGYVGRCSFDTILHGASLEDAQLKFVECNGRWGGTSLPMMLYRRLFGKNSRFSYLARDCSDKRLKGIDFQNLMRIFNDSLFNRQTGKGHYILYNVGCLKTFGKFDVMVLGESQEELNYRSSEEIPKLIAQNI